MLHQLVKHRGNIIIVPVLIREHPRNDVIRIIAIEKGGGTTRALSDGEAAWDGHAPNGH
jgi:hypothetical protein